MARNLIFNINGRRCYPNYSEGISFTASREGDERYYRTKMDGELTFLNGTGDYAWILAQPFDTDFKITVSTDDGRFFWMGIFHKTDCVFNADDKTVGVTPEADDLYKRIIERIDDKFDIVKLAPRATAIDLTKRAVVQVYIVTNGNVGDKVVTNWLGNMTWEEPASVPGDYSESQMESYLTTVCAFTKIPGVAAMRVTTSGMDGIYLASNERIDPTSVGTWRFNGPNGYYVTVQHETKHMSGYLRNVTTTILYSSAGIIQASEELEAPSLGPFPEPTLNGDATYTAYDSYIRWIHDKDGVSGSILKRVDDDLTDYNLNYRYVKPYTERGLSVVFIPAESNEPTEYGMDEFGRYFEYPNPFPMPGDEFRPYHPIAKSTWSPMSVWLQTDFNLIGTSDLYGVEYTLRDAYSLANIVKILLHEIVPDPVNGISITHEGVMDYSRWLYGRQHNMPFIAPNSNVKKAYYSNPAQKGEMTLRQLLDMLRDCFNVYWFISDDGKFHLEHISYFETNDVVADLTRMIAPKNLKPWSSGQSEWSYDKVKLPERIEYAYADSQTEPFNGCVLQYKSNYVQRGEVEKVSVSGFCADVDYAIELPSSVSDDGWIVLLPKQVAGGYKVEITMLQYPDRIMLIQNGRMAFYSLFFEFLNYDMSCPKFNFADKDYDNGAMSLRKVRKQTVLFPSESMPYPYGLIKTGPSAAENGEISDMVFTPLNGTINATVYFNTEY